MNRTDQDLSPLAEKKIYFFDLDGTIYLGDHLFDGNFTSYPIIQVYPLVII